MLSTVFSPSTSSTIQSTRPASSGHENFAQGILLRSRLGVTERYQQTPYPVWDLSLAREAGRIHPFLQMANLSNTGYEEITGVRMPGRSFTGGIELVLAKRKQ